MKNDDLERRLHEHLKALTDIGPRHQSNMPAVESALAYITDTLKSYGYQVRRIQYGPAAQNVNLIADTGTQNQKTPVLEMCAHWDSVEGSPGADDNASGVASLLEIAYELVNDPSQSRLRFCFFGDEEDSDQYPQGRGGSREHVRQLATNAVEGAIVLEMVGYTDHRPGSQQFPPSSTDDQQSEQEDTPGIFIAAVGNTRSRDYVEAIVSANEILQQCLPVAPVITGDADGQLARSDHASYWDADRPGVMVTDTANFRNPNYHTPNDTVETLDLTFTAQVTHALIGAVRRLVG